VPDDPASQDARACAVCGRVLERVFDRNDDETLAYQHSISDRTTGGDDHPPVPVRYSEAGRQLQLRCDFCFADEVTHTLVTSKELQAELIKAHYDTEWAMCSTCSTFVIAGDWLNLRRHAFGEFERQYGPMHPATATEMRVLYRDIRDSLLFIYQEAS
jgi:hypothetical protein